MQNKYRVIIFAEPELSGLIREGIYKDPFIQICGEASCPSDLKKLIANDKLAIVIVEVKHHMLGSDAFKDVVDFLASNKMISLAICDDIKDGFFALQENVTAMVVRPKSLEPDASANFFNGLKTKIKTIQKQSELDTRVIKQDLGLAFPRLVAIGSSTGGTETTLQILKELPANGPPVLIVQHMPPVFSKLYAERMNRECKMSVWEAKDGDLIRPGLVLIAPGDYHMTVTKTSGNYAVKCTKGAKVNGHCPSVDTLFYSVANTVGKNAIGIILTGMGADGAKGLLDMKKRGALTLGQDEESCVVYGMPKVAYEIGAVTSQVRLSEMASVIMENIS